MRDSVKSRDANIHTPLVQDIKITPTNPKPGNQINIEIKGVCEERVPVEINYEQTIPIVGNTFTVQINKVHVPWPKNRLFIEAKNVESLNVAVKFLLWIHKKIEAINGVASYVMRDVPKGTYNVRLSGATLSGASSVEFKITAFSELQLDEAGCCVYTFHPGSGRGGKFVVKCDQIEKSIEIKHSE